MNEWEDFYFNYLMSIPEGSKVLYVGCRKKTDWSWYKYLNKCDINILEIFGPNVKYIKDYVKNNNLNINVIKGDIANHDVSMYDAVIWIDGPEHLPKSQSIEIINKIVLCKYYLLLGPTYKSPHKNQKASYGNKAEKHHFVISEEFLQQFNGEIKQVDERCIILKNYRRYP